MTTTDNIAKQQENDQAAEFAADSMKWRGRVLTGRYWHWCHDWDWLPVDETTPEWPCGCGVKEAVDGNGK